MTCSRIGRGAILLVAVLGTSAAYGDSVCERGFRDTTGA